MGKLVIASIIFLSGMAHAQVVLDPNLAPLQFSKMEKMPNVEKSEQSSFDTDNRIEVTTITQVVKVNGLEITCRKQVKKDTEQVLGYGCESVPDPCYKTTLCN